MQDADLEAVLEGARKGSSAAFAELYRRFSGRVFGLCRYTLGSAEAAEDATSEVFLRVQRAMNSYDSSLAFPSWILSVASNYCVDVLRRRQLESRLFVREEVEPAAESEPTPLAQLLSSESRRAMRDAIARLPARYRVPLVLRYYSEFTYDQIAAQLGLTRAHVATLIFRAKKELRVLLATAKKDITQ